MAVTESILQSFTLAIPPCITYRLTICKPTFQFILGLLSVNHPCILVMWINGIKNPPTISVGGSLFID